MIVVNGPLNDRAGTARPYNLRTLRLFLMMVGETPIVTHAQDLCLRQIPKIEELSKTA